MGVFDHLSRARREMKVKGHHILRVEGMFIDLVQIINTYALIQSIVTRPDSDDVA